MKKTISAIVLFLVLTSNLFAQETPAERRTYTTKSIGNTEAPSIDGSVDDAAWDLVEWTSDYVQWEPDNGVTPTQQTKMKIVYDEKNLYVAFYCYESDMSQLERRMGRRDDFPGDWVEINLDSFNDDRTAFSFTASVSGVKGDEFVSNNGNFDPSWNPIWYLRTDIVEDGWIAEMRIPLSQLRFGKSEEQVWGIQSTRRYFANEERSTWQPIPANPPGWVSEFGELRGLIGLKPQKQLEIQPYLVTQLDTYEKEPGNPFRDGADAKVVPGLDAKIGVTNDLTLDLTVNPDFGQVDADPGAVALDGFEIFFQERRPFFVENKNIFDFGFGGADNLFFSRRIGRAPQGSAFGSNTAFAEQPLNTTILGAAKFSGKTKDGWSIGVLESVTANEFATIRQTDGTERKEIVEPLTNFFITRAQKDFNERNSFIGGIFTATNRHLNGDFNELHKAAYSGGIDFQHNWKNREYYIDGNVIFSHVLGSVEAIEKTQRSITRLFQRPGANHVNINPNRTSLTGTGGRFEFGKAGGQKWRYNTGLIWRSPELELNDVGFLRNTDQVLQFANVDYLWLVPSETYRNMSINFEELTEYDFDGNLNRLRFELAGNVNWIKNEGTRIGIGANFNRFNNFFLRGGPRWRSPNTRYIFTSFNSDNGKKFSYNFRYVNVHADEDVFSRNRFTLGFNYQPFDAFSISFENQLQLTKDRSQYITTTTNGNKERYVLGTMINDQLRTTLRFTYSINPNMTIQFYGQPFISRGRFSDLKYVNVAYAERFSDRVNLYSSNQISKQNDTFLIDENTNGITDYSFSNPDFSFVQLQTNLVARWEYIPGSELFLVWSRGSVGNANSTNGLLDSVSDQVFNEPANDTFLVKLTYRFAR